jgi:hypothetical protein
MRSIRDLCRVSAPCHRDRRGPPATVAPGMRYSAGANAHLGHLWRRPLWPLKGQGRGEDDAAQRYLMHTMDVDRGRMP